MESSFLDQFAKTFANLFSDSNHKPDHKTEINNQLIHLYISMVRRMADIDGDLEEAELHYYQKLESNFFNKNNKQLNWDMVAENIYEEALRASREKWNHPFTMAEIMSLTEGNPALRRDLFEIACITAGADHKFVKTERKFLDLIALEFKISDDEKVKLMKLHHLA